jgi:hypothetical protein
MKVIPGLLQHRSPRWREAAIQLLRDIGTDEALDKLVLLLNDPDATVKAYAGRTLAEMLKSRSQDLRARASFLPPRTDSIIWPLEEYFPGRLAIPIAESLGIYSTKSEAINYAAWAYRALYKDQEGDVAQLVSFLHRWRRIPRDIRLRRWRRRAGRALALTGYALALAHVFMSFSLQLWGYRTTQALSDAFSVTLLAILPLLGSFFLWKSFAELSHSTREKRKPRPRPRDIFALLGDFHSYDGRAVNLRLLIAIAPMVGFNLIILGVAGRRWALPLVTLVVCVGGGALLQRLSWPDNPLIPAVADILPPQEVEKHGADFPDDFKMKQRGLDP